jgi:hypothetical protein
MRGNNLQRRVTFGAAQLPPDVFYPCQAAFLFCHIGKIRPRRLRAKVKGRYQRQLGYPDSPRPLTNALHSSKAGANHCINARQQIGI